MDVVHDCRLMQVFDCVRFEVVRRDVHLVKLNDVLTECQRLHRAGYVSNGKWSLGQICRHIRLTLDANVDGYPWWMSLAMPIRPLLRWLFLPKLLRGDSPAGIKTASIFVPPGDLNDADEITALAESISRFFDHQGELYPHPGFGRLSPELFETFHAAHASHHLSFLDDRREAK
jgi:hypothetical protein